MNSGPSPNLGLLNYTASSPCPCPFKRGKMLKSHLRLEPRMWPQSPQEEFFKLVSFYEDNILPYLVKVSY
jgi:hypothetical protein